MSTTGENEKKSIDEISRSPWVPRRLCIYCGDNLSETGNLYFGKSYRVDSIISATVVEIF